MLPHISRLSLGQGGFHASPTSPLADFPKDPSLEHCPSSDSHGGQSLYGDSGEDSPGARCHVFTSDCTNPAQYFQDSFASRFKANQARTPHMIPVSDER